MVSLLGVQGYRLQFHSTSDDTIDRPNLIVTETIIEDFNYDLTKVTSPIFDTIANAAGWRRSLISYDEHGSSSLMEIK